MTRRRTARPTQSLVSVALCLLGAIASSASVQVGGHGEVQTGQAEAKDHDRYFAETSVVTSEDGPRAITRNLLQDRDGDYWLASWNGIVHFDGTTFTNVTNKEGLRRYRQGILWFGTVGAGLYRYDGKTFTNLTTKDGLVDDTVLSIFQDSSGALWFGGMGLTKYDGTTFTAFTEEDGFTSADVHSISEAPDGSLWFGTRGALFRYDGESFTDFAKQHAIDIDRGSYTPALVDRQGHVWFGGSEGIYHFDGEQVRHLFPLPSFTLFEDSRGHVWFSGGGLEGDEPRRGMSVLNRFDPAGKLEDLRSTSQRYLIHNPALFGMMEDESGQVWFGTGSGIGRIEGKLARYY